MQLQLISFVLILTCMEYTDCQQQPSRHRQNKQIPGVSSGCQGGCLTCSDYNGCLSCKPRLFIFLERNGMRQIGVCLPSCPSGFYGTRSPDRNTCTKCRPECDSCFNKNLCMRCRAGYYLHLGKCQESCPESLVCSDTQRECVPKCPADCDACLINDTCTRCRPGLYLLLGKCHHVCPDEFEPNDKLMECSLQVHCEVGEWGEWSPCSRSGKTCGFKWGEETRTREVVQFPSAYGKPCPPIWEKKECVLKRRRCPGQGKGRKGERRGERRNRDNRRDKDSQGEGRRERKKDRERERGETGDREDSENRNKTEQRRRRGQNRDLVVSPEGGGPEQ
ncbi:R-spondin-3 isoform X2 [Salmo salar]|uniref:R-spondin-3 isoform X2 n=1 Tax=Salmo salar TaxID=8030 RepID=A0A1S3RX11_SALSA|nr:R-spondin-3-like isoform X2 [Salmo salar]|eukprot:XP_014056783.1 PREDICTED: R-spondin-3-like isoform X2 [Salmo salar]